MLVPQRVLSITTLLLPENRSPMDTYFFFFFGKKVNRNCLTQFRQDHCRSLPQGCWGLLVSKQISPRLPSQIVRFLSYSSGHSLRWGHNLRQLRLLCPCTAGVIAFGSTKEQSSCWRLEPWPPCSASASYKTHSSIPGNNQDLLFSAGNALYQGL